jgi:CheY-like chemotaxis protein
LIVDDQERDRYILKGILAALGRFDVIEAANGEDAMSQARRQGPDVIFLDLILPDVSGWGILDRLRSDETTRHIPVIIRTSSDLDDDERGHLESQAAAILAKGSRSREEAVALVRDSLWKAGLYP